MTHEATKESRFKVLKQAIDIEAPQRIVWESVVDPLKYERWTAVLLGPRLRGAGTKVMPFVSSDRKQRAVRMGCSRNCRHLSKLHFHPAFGNDPRRCGRPDQ